MFRILAGALVAVLAAVGCEGGFEDVFQTSTPVVVVVTATPTPTVTPTPDPTPSPTPVIIVVTATPTPWPTSTPVPTATARPTATPTPTPTPLPPEGGHERWIGNLSEPEIFRLPYRGGYLEMEGFGRDEGIGVVEVVESSGGIPANYVRAFGFVLSNVSDDPEIQSDALVLVTNSPTRVHLRIKFSGEVLRTQERSFEREEFGNYGFLYFLNSPPESIEWDHRYLVKLDLLVEG